MNFQFKNLSVVLVAGALLVSCSSSEKKESQKASLQASMQRDALEIQKLAEDVYIYGYPMVVMETSREVMTNVPRVSSQAAPVNHFAHRDSFPDASFNQVPSPNADTLYSSAWLDLSEEPIVLSLPDMGKRYYLMPILSAWSDVIASPGTRTTGQKKADFAVTGPNWSGTLPAGVIEIKSPTNTAWIIGRTQTNGKKDYAAVRAIQKKYRLTPLSAWSPNIGNKPVSMPVATVNESIDMKTAPVDQVENMEGVEFMNHFASYLKRNPPKPEDADLVQKMNRLGITPGKDFEVARLSDLERDAINQGAKSAIEKIIAMNGAGSGVEIVDGWMYSYHIGAYGADFDNRAMVAKYFLGANLPQDSVYPRTQVDATGVPLNGSNRYTLRFAKDQLPPVNAFWSLTMYNSKQFFVKNSLNRFAIGDRDRLKYNRDGSLDIYIQSDNPGRDKVANWLPSPAGEDFNMVMRLYWPKEKVLSLDWRVPGVQRVQPASGLSLR